VSVNFTKNVSNFYNSLYLKDMVNGIYFARCVIGILIKTKGSSMNTTSLILPFLRVMVFFLGVTFPTFASLIVETDSIGRLTGIKNVEANGVFYDIELAQGKFSDFFTSETEVEIATDSFMRTIGWSILNNVILGTVFDDAADNTVICSGGHSGCAFKLLFRDTNSVTGDIGLVGMNVEYAIPGGGAGLTGFTISSAAQLELWDSNWGLWQVSSSISVPEPWSSSILAVGLITILGGAFLRSRAAKN
jgi:hypothetical protein